MPSADFCLITPSVAARRAARIMALCFISIMSPANAGYDLI